MKATVSRLFEEPKKPTFNYAWFYNRLNYLRNIAYERYQNTNLADVLINCINSEEIYDFTEVEWEDVLKEGLTLQNHGPRNYPIYKMVDDGSFERLMSRITSRLIRIKVLRYIQDFPEQTIPSAEPRALVARCARLIYACISESATDDPADQLPVNYEQFIQHPRLFTDKVDAILAPEPGSEVTMDDLWDQSMDLWDENEQLREENETLEARVTELENMVALTEAPTDPLDELLPVELRTEQARNLLRKAQEGGLLDERFQPTGNKQEAALLADSLAERLRIVNLWKVFEQLWNTKNMSVSKSKALGSTSCQAILERVAAALD